MMANVVKGIYDDYVVGTRDLNQHLAKLQLSKRLTAEEKLQKNVVEASLVLMDRYGVTGALAADL